MVPNKAAVWSGLFAIRDKVKGNKGRAGERNGSCKIFK